MGAPSVAEVSGLRSNLYYQSLQSDLVLRRPETSATVNDNPINPLNPLLKKWQQESD